MNQYRDEMEKIIYEEFGDILREKDRIIEETDYLKLLSDLVKEWYYVKHRRRIKEN